MTTLKCDHISRVTAICRARLSFLIYIPVDHERIPLIKWPSFLCDHILTSPKVVTYVPPDLRNYQIVLEMGTRVHNKIYSADIVLDFLLPDKMSGEINLLRWTFSKCPAGPANFAYSDAPTKAIRKFIVYFTILQRGTDPVVHYFHIPEQKPSDKWCISQFYRGNQILI